MKTTKLTKLQAAFNALRDANGDVSRAKILAAARGVRISARTWNKAIQLRTAVSPVPVLRNDVSDSELISPSARLAERDRLNNISHSDYRRELWTKACKEDSIDPTSRFVVFSDDNVAARAYHNFVVAYFQAQKLANGTGSSVIVTQHRTHTASYSPEYTLTAGVRIGHRIYPNLGR
jgi:hypothetical protein